jgi:phosphate-selective porin
MAYFPDAWAEIAKVSVVGNKQHNLGATKLYFNRFVSTDHLNKVMRHLLDHESGRVFDTDQTRHLAKAAWRILAALQVSIELEVANQAQQALSSAGINCQGVNSASTERF